MSEAKTEEPTPRREQRARAEGRAWQSRDLTLGAALVAAGGIVRLGGATVSSGLRASFARALGTLEAAPSEALARALADGARIALPLLLAVVVVSAVASALQVRGLLALSAIAPNPARFSLGATGSRSIAQALAGVVRVAIVLVVSALTLAEGMPGIATLSRQAPHTTLDALLTMANAMLLRVGLAMLALGVVDAVMERAFFRASLRMSRREVERERREAEGDAFVKRERDRVREELWRSAAADELASAALVVEGEAVAIALAYEATDVEAVPRVVAVERGSLAEDLVRSARERSRAIVRDDALAASLAIVPLGHAIPEALYEQVASLLARSTAS